MNDNTIYELKKILFNFCLEEITKINDTLLELYKENTDVNEVSRIPMNIEKLTNLSTDYLKLTVSLSKINNNVP